MYQPYETETWGELRGELRHEAELRARRTLAKRAQRKASFASAMRRRAALLLSTLGLALIMAAGAAYAMDVIQCGPSHATPCLGTEAPDVMNGTAGVDHIVGLDDVDEIHGLASPDRLVGDGNFAVQGDDRSSATAASTRWSGAAAPTSSRAARTATRSPRTSSPTTAPIPSGEAPAAIS